MSTISMICEQVARQKIHTTQRDSGVSMSRSVRGVCGAHFVNEEECTNTNTKGEAMSIFVIIYFCIAAVAMSRCSSSGVMNTHVSSGMPKNEGRSSELGPEMTAVCAS